MLDTRLLDLQEWLRGHLPVTTWELSPLAGDASFRRYFRVRTDNTSWVAMDAPPDKEDSHNFVGIAKVFANLGVTVPQIITANLEQGFLLITDFGNQLYWQALNTQTADPLYRAAIQSLITIQSCPQDKYWHFPTFAEIMVEELKRFREWFLLKHLGLTLNSTEEKILEDTFAQLVASALEQPQICVHRDYHSRNLMVLPDKKVGILDFQDAVWGPITYDLVSLIRDCYIAWPKPQVETWALHYYQLANSKGLLQHNNPQQFIRWFDWMGVQRHLKAIYIFARKLHRDNNPNYLKEIPRTLQYVLDITSCYPEFTAFKKLLASRVSL